MEKSIFRFIWTHSKKSQLTLLLITLLTFPILYISLELPKRIINDAIGGPSEGVVVLGISFGQVEFLMLLCAGFLLAVLANGLLKMRLNTMKGVLAERLLRRFRYQLLTRIMRFPRPYFRKTSQGELVSMVTAEAEPLGGIMGDMLSQPILQAGQMLTILAFLFAQSLWFGLAAIALIPLQAWIIPILQRQINRLNKNRIQEVRKLAADIGETAAGVSDLRTNGGLRYRMSLFSNRLGKLYDIRFEIYQKKFFMKFLNNFINQLTPFFFYSVGGYLAIQGHITVGALVAALAAFKDMSSPWKELLAFYNTTQDVALRWDAVIEKFAPSPLVDNSLFEGAPDKISSLKGKIELNDVTVHDDEGQIVLENINLVIPQGARVAIKTDSEAAALSFADLLTREVVPQRGNIMIAGKNINTIHQVALANRIGYAHSNPHIMQGTLGENILLPFKNKPLQVIDEQLDTDEQTDADEFRLKAEQSGNSIDLFDANWIDPTVAGLQSVEEIREWWFELVQAMGSDDFMVRRALRSNLQKDKHQKLTNEIVRLRPEIARRLSTAGLDDVVYRFHPDKYNPISPLGSNLLYALPTRTLTQLSLSQEGNFVRILHEQGIAQELMQMSVTMIESLTATFGTDGTDHPIFQRLNLEEELYHRLGKIINQRREVGDSELPFEDYSLMLTIPFAFSAEQMGPAFNDTFKERILQIRKSSAAQMVDELDGLFETINPDKYIPVMTLLGNAIFGRISKLAGARESLIEDIVVDVITEHGLRRLAAESIYDVVTTTGGDNLPTIFKERLAFSRASIKKPDILILANSLASHDSETRSKMRERIGGLLPDTTIFFIENQFNRPENYDIYAEIINGRIDGGSNQEIEDDTDGRQDLNRKIEVIRKTELFGSLDIKHQRLLAFGAQWYKAETGRKIFAINEVADAAYLCIKGKAGLYWTSDDNQSRLVSEIIPGRLIGDLSIILNERRPLDLIAMEDSMFLRISDTELMAVIENDAIVASSLMRTVAGHLMTSIGRVRAMRNYSIERGIDFSEFDND